jgi:hypothetical protein
MNKKRKVLTIVALVAFGAIIALHYGSVYFGDFPHASPQRWPYQNNVTKEWHIKNWTLQHHWERPEFRTNYPALKDIRLPLFVLAVFYSGLFALLGDTKTR